MSCNKPIFYKPLFPNVSKASVFGLAHFAYFKSSLKRYFIVVSEKFQTAKFDKRAIFDG